MPPKKKLAMYINPSEDDCNEIEADSTVEDDTKFKLILTKHRWIEIAPG